MTDITGARGAPVTHPRSDTGAGARELRESEQRFRLLVDSVVDYAIYLLDPDGRVETWNAGAERLKGYHADEILGQHYSTFYTEDAREAGLPQQLLAAALEHGRVENSGWRVRRDGTRFWANVVITALFDDGQHTGFAKVTRDMTDRHVADEALERTLEEQRLAMARLEDLDRWRREFIGSIVHDLQTPVTAIDGFVRLLLAGSVAEEQRPDALEAIGSNARSLQELIDNLRAFTLLSAGRVTLSLEPVALRPFVHELIASMAPLFGERERYLDIDEVTVTADRQGLERILRNLLTNAVRHTGASVPVAVRARADGAGVAIAVEDRGPGIANELLPRVFERFESGGSGGTGLGLAIARQYVELHGGTIAVDSTEGEGSTFIFTIPDQRAARSKDAAPPDAASVVQGRTVAVGDERPT